MSIRNVVFDVGNVLFAYRPSAILDALLPQTPHKEFYLSSLVNNPIWDALDRGDLSAEEAAHRVSHGQEDASRKKSDMLLFIDQFADHLDLIEPSKTLFLELSQKMPVYILSNFQSMPFKRLLAANPFMDEAKGRIVSEDVRLAKPEKAIYELLLSQFSLNPQETLFLDDKIENIEACHEVGMNGIVFQTYDQVIREMRRFDYV